MPFFRARADGGITPAEATRREEALRAARAGEHKPVDLPPRMPWPSPIAIPADDELQRQIITPDDLDSEVAEAMERAEAEGVGDVPPVITITISGPPHSGKSALAHMIRATLAHYGAVFRGPNGLASFHWRRALDFAMRNDLSVEIVEKTDGFE